MRKRALGFLLAIVGFGGMALAGYLFVTGPGGRGLLIEVTGYMIVGAACFFAGLNYIYDEANTYAADQALAREEPEDVSPIQQQWRTIHIAQQQSAKQSNNQRTTTTVA